MITVRKKRKLGMTTQQLAGIKKEAFLVDLGKNFLDFVEKYSKEDNFNDSLLYEKMAEAVKAKDYKSIEKMFSIIQVFGTYDRIAQTTVKYKNLQSAVGNAFNGTVFEGHADEKNELDRIIAHTCGMCSPKGDEFLEKILA